MIRRAYIAVEGPHDAAFVAALLHPAGLRRVQRLADLDEFWVRLVPRTYPHRDDLLARVPVPLFLAGADCSVAIHGTSWDGSLHYNIEETMSLVDGSQLSVGVILDADKQIPATARFEQLAKQLRSLGLAIPNTAGEVSVPPGRCGIFVLPDNKSNGTLETILLECAQEVYPELLVAARTFVNTIDITRYNANDMKDFAKPAGRSKATVASTASILRPGKSIQVSIQDNRWFQDEALKIPSVVAVQTFLANLLAP